MVYHFVVIDSTALLWEEIDHFLVIDSTAFTAGGNQTPQIGSRPQLRLITSSCGSTLGENCELKPYSEVFVIGTGKSLAVFVTGKRRAYH